MKKTFIFLGAALLLLSSFSPSVRDAGTEFCKSFFPAEKGTELTYQSFNSKDKLQMTNIMTIMDVVETSESLKIDIHAKSLDKKGKDVFESDFAYICEDGQFKIPMETILDEAMMNGYEGMEVSITQTDMLLPADLNVGQDLPDAGMEMIISSNGIKMISMNFNITDRKIEKKESITTPAGTFECYKLTQSTNTKMMFMDRTDKSTSWICENIGTVRSESYNSDGDLESYELLTNIKR